MSFFQPTLGPGKMITTHQAVRPPPLDNRISHDEMNSSPSEPFQCLSPPGSSLISIPHSSTRSFCVFNPQDALDSYSVYSNHIVKQNPPCSLHSIPIIPNHGVSHPSAQSATPPPSYTDSFSPPIYKLLSSSSDPTILLAPPPSFHHAVCICPQSEQGDLLPQYRCVHCLGERERPQKNSDWVVLILLLLNLVVWGIVLYGYYCEFTSKTTIWNSWTESILRFDYTSGQDAMEWNWDCWGGECTGTYIDY
nr:hypothetical protein L203_03323 [Cryptococcus depauperatus CBS 7841]